MDERLLSFLVFFPLLSVCGIALVGIGLSGIRRARRQQEQERARTTGIVVDFVVHRSLRRGKPPSWHPVVEFEADGRLIRQECRDGYWLDQFRVGEQVDLLYDADDPGRYHLEKLFDANVTGDRVTVAVGILWIAIAGVVAWLISR